MPGCRGRPPPRTRSRPRFVWQRASQTLFFDYENDDEDEEQFICYFRHLSLMSLHSNCPAGAPFSERSLGKSLVH